MYRGVAIEVWADRGPLTGPGGPWNAGGYPAHADWVSCGGVAMDILCGTGNEIGMLSLALPNLPTK